MFRPEDFAPVPFPAEPELALVRTDARLFEQLDGSVVPRRFWPDASQFERDGVGFTLLVRGEPVSTAFSSFVKGRQLELGIETHPAHRGRGWAAVVCARLITHCLDNGLEPLWSCHGANAGSRALAEKLGFRVTHRLPYYHLSW